MKVREVDCKCSREDRLRIRLNIMVGGKHYDESLKT
jgi:hypothetical protein